MSRLYNKKPSRLFTFGCSVTKYHWSMWPEILGLALNIPTFNYGRSGASNAWIANTVVLANKKYHFNKNDLVIVSWTESNRLEFLQGNIWTRDPDRETDEYTISHQINQLTVFSTMISYLRNTNAQVHYTSMSDFMRPFVHIDEQVGSLRQRYKDEFDILLPSLASVVGQGYMDVKVAELRKIFGNRFFDGHPFPNESLHWLTKMFDFDFSNVKQQVADHTDRLLEDINKVTQLPDYIAGPEYPGINPEKIRVTRYLIPMIGNDLEF